MLGYYYCLYTSLKLFQAAVCYEPWHIVKQRLSLGVLLANILLIETLFMYV